ncbi:MAG TPA: heme-binding domain-containing protein [Gaiellaceae bacterium]|nr:heme-binding domain-containing protein [Gaiellaceae bacterium]
MLSRRNLLRGAVALVVLLLAIQLVPYGRDHADPAVAREPAWDTPATRELARAACFDCHSNLTTWPWYSNVAPVSWLVQRDVDVGRQVLNFSEWGGAQEVDDVVEAVQEGSMPPIQYRLLHAGARLSDAQRRELASGLEATLARSPAAP